MFILETPLNAKDPCGVQKEKEYFFPQTEGQQSHYAACYSVIKVSTISKKTCTMVFILQYPDILKSVDDFQAIHNRW